VIYWRKRFNVQGSRVWGFDSHKQGSAPPLATGVYPPRSAASLIERETPSNSAFKKGESDKLF